MIRPRRAVKRPCAANESPRPWGVGASNELADGDWQRISAYGDFPNEAGLQRVGREDAEAMVAAFNSIRGRLGRMFRGLPIFAGHPDADPVRYKDHRRYGKIEELDARDDGLYGRVAWNSLGRENIDEGYMLYPSPRWYLRKDGRHVRPDELISVGLTNRPNIPGDPWAKNEAGESAGSDNPNTEGDDTMPQWLRDMLLAAGLIKPEASNEEQVKGAVKGLIDGRAAAANEKTQAEGRATAITVERDALKTERDGLRTQLAAANERATGLGAERDALRGARADAEIRHLQAVGKLSPADAAARRTELLACANETELKAKLDGLHAAKPAMKTGAITRGLGERSAAANEERDRQATINEAVSARMKESGLRYPQAFAAVKRDPKYRPLFDAMRKPGQGD
ncbi:MAG TPA: phage protease [Verrucomicrobiae bacterium]|nr:phage protease [Verrucomicrobiae bacterium]